MPQPLDAERAAAQASSDPRSGPTPAPRASSEALTLAAVEERADELEVQPEELVPEPQGVDVWGLVHRAQEGDAEAFGELYDHYVTMVHRYVYHRVLGAVGRAVGVAHVGRGDLEPVAAALHLVADDVARDRDQPSADVAALEGQ